MGPVEISTPINRTHKSDFFAKNGNFQRFLGNLSNLDVRNQSRRRWDIRDGAFER